MDWHAVYILCPDQVLQAWLPNILHTVEQLVQSEDTKYMSIFFYRTRVRFSKEKKQLKKIKLWNFTNDPLCLTLGHDNKKKIQCMDLKTFAH